MRALFESRTQREKFLVLFMMIVGLLIWASFFGDRLSALMADRRSLNTRIADQRLWLDERDQIRARVEAGIQNLDPSRTLSATRLMAELQNMARNHDLTPSIGTPRTEEADVFSYNTVELRVDRAELGPLINLTSEIQQRSPYMGIERVVLRADRTNPTLLEARFTISSVELNP